jgi:hypothetical protein
MRAAGSGPVLLNSSRGILLAGNEAAMRAAAETLRSVARAAMDVPRRR